MTRKQRKTKNRIIISSIAFIAYCLLDLSGYVEIIAAIIIYLFIGHDVLRKAFINIGHGQIFDENFLMSIATFGAFGCYEFSEAIAVMLFYQIGELFQSVAVGNSRKSIQSLLELKVEEVLVLVGNEFEEKDIEDIVIGDIILVKAGQKIGVDGKVIEGSGYIDMSALTGESVPCHKDVGQEVLSGSINLSTTMKIEVTKEYEDSTVAKILEMVENATEKKAKAEAFITKFARYYTPIVVCLALALAIVPSVLFGDFSQWMHRACVFLVVSCPCALVISVPLTFFGGIGKASKNGILVKGSNYLEALADVSQICFDKTGTLTKGQFVLKDIISNKMDKEDVLYYMALLEMNSNHPISKAIVKAYDGNLDQSQCSDFEEIAGKGVQAVIDNKNIYVGNKALMDLHQIVVEEVNGTILYLAINNEYIGYVVVEDEIKETSQQFVDYLDNHHIDTMMLTGDSQTVAKDVKERLGVREYRAKLLPGDKVIEIEKCLEKKTGTVVFIGDGINDAPVLSRVDVGISMGQIGSDIAIEASDIVIMDDDLLKVTKAIDIAKRTMVIVHQNIVFALGVKVSVLILSSFGIVGMWAAVFGDVGVTLIAILNARRV